MPTEKHTKIVSEKTKKSVSKSSGSRSGSVIQKTKLRFRPPGVLRNALLSVDLECGKFVPL